MAKVELTHGWSSLCGLFSPQGWVSAHLRPGWFGMCGGGQTTPSLIDVVTHLDVFSAVWITFFGVCCRLRIIKIIATWTLPTGVGDWLTGALASAPCFPLFQHQTFPQVLWVSSIALTSRHGLAFVDLGHTPDVIIHIFRPRVADVAPGICTLLFVLLSPEPKLFGCGPDDQQVRTEYWSTWGIQVLNQSSSGVMFPTPKTRERKEGKELQTKTTQCM